MNALKGAMSAASSGMGAQAFRIRIVSENISNADTHGYQRKLISFRSMVDAVSGQQNLSIGDVTLDRKPGKQVYDPAHPFANQEGYVTFSNVEMMIELADAREASRSYEANLTTFQQARQMYGSLIDLLRR